MMVKQYTYKWMVLLVLLMSVPAHAFQWHGFIDGRSGMRQHNACGQRRSILNELRLQLDASHDSDWAVWQLRSDFVVDEAAGEHNLDLDSGHGAVDLREANVQFFPTDNVDVKLGRQILTWGTGDLLFINDMFPKDWQAFFIGREEEYLKAPSDAALFSLFLDSVNIDVVYVPQFDNDRYITGERLSYWNPMLQRHGVRDDEMAVERRRHFFRDDEINVRLYRDVGGYELAAYAYDGYWKSPVGYAVDSGRQTFPRLRVFGASMRGTLADGVVNLEGGYYDSINDRNGDDPFIPNSEYRALIGYEHELARNLTAAAQYYLEHIDEYSAYSRNLPASGVKRDRDRHVITVRITRQAFNQNLTLSLFSYWSPSDCDGYLRPALKYKASDTVSIYAGANLFFGEKNQTFFGQFEENNNFYFGARYSF